MAENDVLKAREVFSRHHDLRMRGHDVFCDTAMRNDDFYLGGGLQWRENARAKLEAQGRPAREVNEIMQAVNTVAGYQIHNRMDVAFLPRNSSSDPYKAMLTSKLVKYDLDATGFRYVETQVFMDGLIQQRGYFDIRMDYQDNAQGKIKIVARDPLDILPDADAKSYDPDDWADVLDTRWMTACEIEAEFGKDIAAQVVAACADGYRYDQEWGAQDGVPRSAFGIPIGYGTWASNYDDGRVRRYRLISRQVNQMQSTLVAQFPTGDTKIIEGAQREQIAALIDQGVFVTNKRMRRVWWEIVLPDVTVRDALSPYKHFTIVPYFPIFRRGRTRGMVDNAISPQETKNKAISTIEHIVNTMANSGWFVPKDSLTNMTTEDLEERGAETGLIVEYEKAIGKPDKIVPNQMPSGFAGLVDMSTQNLRSVLGVNESLLGLGKDDMSGVALQSRQFASQQQQALPLDNLGQTRRMVVDRVLGLQQTFLTEARIVRITDTDSNGKQSHSMLSVNQPQEDGSYLNDLTMGEYDLVITETPLNITYDNSQYEQAKEMKKEGVNIPDAYLIRKSSLSDKEELAAANESAQAPVDPRIDANAKLMGAQANLANAQAVTAGVTGLFEGIRTAQAIVSMPSTAQIADGLLRSAGFKDQDAPPIYPNAPAEAAAAGVPPPADGSVPPPPNSTNPLTPDHPDVGAQVGLGTAPTPLTRTP